MRLFKFLRRNFDLVYKKSPIYTFLICLAFSASFLASISIILGIASESKANTNIAPSEQVTIIERTQRYSGFGSGAVNTVSARSDEVLLRPFEIFDVEGTALNPYRNRITTRQQALKINALLPTMPILNAVMPPFSMSNASALDGERALHCLTLAVYFEAASESLDGQRAVAQVVLNRVRHPAWPDTVCGVVFQGSERRTGCQFSFTCDGALRRIISRQPWESARSVAFFALHGSVMEEVSVATHYHTDWVAPYWAPSLRKLTKVGTHIFYTWAGRGGMPGAFRMRHEGAEAWPIIAGLTAPELNSNELDFILIDESKLAADIPGTENAEQAADAQKSDAAAAQTATGRSKEGVDGDDDAKKTAKPSDAQVASLATGDQPKAPSSFEVFWQANLWNVQNPTNATNAVSDAASGTSDDPRQAAEGGPTNPVRKGRPIAIDGRPKPTKSQRH
jgi:hypothetical protein